MKEQPKKIFGSLKEYEENKAARKSGKTISKAAEEAIKNKQPIYGTLKEHDEAQDNKKRKLEEIAKISKIFGLQNEIIRKKEEKQNLLEQIKKASQSKNQMDAQAVKVLKIKMSEAENKIRQLEDGIDIIKYPGKNEIIAKKREIENIFNEYKEMMEILKEKNEIIKEHIKTYNKIKDLPKGKEYESLESKAEHLRVEIASLSEKSANLKKKLIDSKFLTEDTLKLALAQEEKFRNKNVVIKEIFQPYLTGQAA